MPIRLRLKHWKVLQTEESGAGTRITAQYTALPASCPRCGLADPPLYRHDIRTQEFADTPQNGKPVRLAVKRRRYVCRACGCAFQEQLPAMEPGRVMTRRLARYIRQAVRNRKFTEIAVEVGVHEKTVRNISQPSRTSRTP